MSAAPKTYTSLIIGTGFSGIAMAIKLKEKNIHDFIILEKAKEVGGTWRENTYPGAECDIPSALYSYSFESYTEWEYKWSLQHQILDYIKHCVKKYDIEKHIVFQEELTKAHWEENGYWKVYTKGNSTYYTKTLIPAIGQLHHPNIPNFNGLNTFKGPSWHSAKWNHQVALEGKRVGVIGNAASAAQFIPEIAKMAKEVIVFQRTPNWFLPKQDRLYKEWEKKLVRKFPVVLKLYRLKLWLMGGALFIVLNKWSTPIRKYFEWRAKRYIKRTIDDPKLREKLLPQFPMGAKRLLFSDTYFQAINQKNVRLVTSSIQQIQTKGIATEEEPNLPIDVLVFGTGFKANPFLLGLEIIGRNGLSIKERWADEHANYLGITVDQFPNLFMMYGPNTNLGHNSIIIMSEAQANYITQCIVAMQQNKWKHFEVKRIVLEQYYKKIKRRLQGMIWTTIDHSWYQTSNGDLPNNWPGRTMEYTRKTKKVDFSKFTKK